MGIVVRVTKFFAGVALLLTTAAGIGVAWVYAIKRSEENMLNSWRNAPRQTVLEDFGPAPDFKLVTNTNARVSRDTYRGKIWVLNFFFSSCTGICSKLTRNMAEVQNSVPGISLLSVSVDPERDSVRKLATYAKKAGANSNKWMFATGDKNEISKLGNKGFRVATSVSASSASGLVHSERFFLIDGNGRIRGMFRGTDDADVQKLKEAVRTLQTASR